MQDLGQGDFEHIVWWDPHIDHRFPDIILPERFIWKSRRPQNKIFIRGASPGISYELWDKNVMEFWRCNIATYEQKICDMEVEIITY